MQAQAPLPNYPGLERPLPPPKPSPEPRLKSVSFTRPPVAPLQNPVEAAVRQQVGSLPKAVGDNETDFITIFTGLPSIERMTDRRESEAQFNERLRQEYFSRPGAPRVSFPDHPPLTKEVYAGRNFKPMVEVIEPGFVMHRRLYFEQPNFERHGWELGYLTPLLSAGSFVSNVVTLPYHVFTRPWDPWDSSAGKLRPGDNPPLLWYRPEYSHTGLLGQAAAVAGFVLTFP
ncbi:MAG: hypothetical protein NZO58_09215 [Gemmataceae bacterium]|nr:hypothetical protein [Gemmataceae bacterium]